MFLTRAESKERLHYTHKTKNDGGKKADANILDRIEHGNISVPEGSGL